VSEETRVRSPFDLLAAAASALLAGLAPAALAADGVLEINQTCATQTGCFAGDKAGFPVTVQDAAPARSFRLTSDLVVPTPNDTAVQIATSRVVIDLAGFAVRGPVSCSGNPLSCSASGSGDGVAVDGSSRLAVTVRNGAVSGMGGIGVSVGARGVVEEVRADQNANGGIQAGNAAQIRGCSAVANGAEGIATSFGGQILESVAESNAGTGISSLGTAVLMANVSRRNGGAGLVASATSVVKDNVSEFNAGVGIATGIAARIADNVVQANLLGGITCTSRCNVSGNTVNGNGTSANNDAIECGVFCAVRENEVSTGQGFGLNLGANAAYRENVIEAVGGAGTVSGGVNRGDNHCGGTGAVTQTCP